MGYSDEKIQQLCRQGLADGWSSFKIKLGRDVKDDRRCWRIMREQIGNENRLMLDANQYWDVDQAIYHFGQLAEFNPWWIEPTSPDDILGHATVNRAIAPIKVAAGEHCHNRIVFKELSRQGDFITARSMRSD